MSIGLSEFMKMITELLLAKWYGKVELSIESGKITLIRKTDTIKEL